MVSFLCMIITEAEDTIQSLFLHEHDRFPKKKTTLLSCVEQHSVRLENSFNTEAVKRRTDQSEHRMFQSNRGKIMKSKLRNLLANKMMMVGMGMGMKCKIAI